MHRGAVAWVDAPLETQRVRVWMPQPVRALPFHMPRLGVPPLCAAEEAVCRRCVDAARLPRAFVLFVGVQGFPADEGDQVLVGCWPHGAQCDGNDPGMFGVAGPADGLPVASDDFVFAASHVAVLFDLETVVTLWPAMPCPRGVEELFELSHYLAGDFEGEFVEGAGVLGHLPSLLVTKFSMGCPSHITSDAKLSAWMPGLFGFPKRVRVLRATCAWTVTSCRVSA